jgi:trehalose synthase
MRQLLNNTEMAAGMGERAREFVRQNFLITRQVRDYLAVWYTLLTKKKSLVEL